MKYVYTISIIATLMTRAMDKRPEWINKYHRRANVKQIDSGSPVQEGFTQNNNQNLMQYLLVPVATFAGAAIVFTAYKNK